MKKSFSERMVYQYPNLFPKDTDGNPAYPECGFYCPPGWENLVETTLFYVNSLVEHPAKKQTYVLWYRCATKLHGLIVRPIYNKLFRMTSPTEKFHWRDGKRLPMIALRLEQVKKAEAESPIKTKLNTLVRACYNASRPKYRIKYVHCPPVQIEQIKEKFGALRMYSYGGNEKTREIISFAEVMSARLCQDTGLPGKSVSRGGWCKTLSEDEAKKQGYK